MSATCPYCGTPLFIGILCEFCLHRTNVPAFVGTEAGQAALAAAAKVVAIQRRAVEHEALLRRPKVEKSEAWDGPPGEQMEWYGK